ncbi:hypothetical protein [Bernardetia sp.]|uniref:hypothetical protein n=1 Tax=Bernardetia sp. TaxID=1937974 RepID=UPI0025C353C6|nr:hypothetical protein [Bernardetia sp.]
MKNFKFLFVLIVACIPCFTLLSLESEPSDDSQDNVVYFVERDTQETNQLTEELVNNHRLVYFNFDEEMPPNNTDAVDISSQHHLVTPFNKISVRDLAAHQTLFRLLHFQNKTFIANNLSSDRQGKA